MWIHCDLRAGPSTLFPPTKVQLDALVSFLLAADLESYQTKCPLPIRGTKENRPRWDPDKAFAHYNIFRDRYEKTIAPEPQHPRDVFEARDWPELGDRVTLNMSVHQHREGFPQVTEEDLEQAEANMWNITPTSPLWPQYVSMRGRYGNGDVGEVLRIRLHCN